MNRVQLFGTSFYRIQQAINQTLSAVAVGVGKIKVTATDTVLGYLGQKLVAGAGITLTPQNLGGDETLLVASTGFVSWPVADNVFGVANAVDPTKLLHIDASGQAPGTTATIYLGGSVSRPFRLPNITGTAVVQQDTTGFVFLGSDVQLHGSNSGVQFSTLVQNRAQFRGNQYGANVGAGGITGFKSRGLTIGSLGGALNGDPLCRMTAIGVTPDNALIPLAGMLTFRVPDSFVPAGQSYLPAELEVQVAATGGPTNSIRRVFVITSDGEVQTLRGVRAGGAGTLPSTLGSGSLWSSGAGAPNGVVSGAIGDLYTDTAGGAGTTLWVKESSPTPTTG